MIIGPPNKNDAPEWYAYFFGLTTGDDLIAALQSSKWLTLELIGSIPEVAADYRYAENKWTVKQLFIHLSDEERYYAYKAFCYSRQSDVNLEIPMSPGYTKDFNAGNRNLKDIAEEYRSVREATISLFSSMTPDMLDFKNFPGKDVYSARSLGWFAVGHNLHHCKVLKEKYRV
jgi:uncharacterized damage-inducible protein DinB